MSVAKQKGQLGIILLTVLISMMGVGILIPVLPLYAENFGASERQLGLLVGVYPFCQFLFASLMGKISDRYGRRPVLLISVAGTAAGFFLMGAAETLWVLFVARIIDGISGANISIAQAYIADITTREERSRSMGLFGATIGLGFILGPFLGGEMSKFSAEAPLYTAGALAVVNLILITLKLPESLTPDKRGQHDPTKKLSDLFGHENGTIFRRVVLAYFASVAGFTIMTTVWPLYLSHRFGYEEKEAGRLMAYIGVIAVLMQGGVLRRLLKKGYREASLAISGSLILAGSLIALTFAGGLGTLLVISAGLAIGNSLINPTLNALASLSADASWQGRALGLMQSSGSLARTVGAVLGGYFLSFDKSKDVVRYAESPLFLSAAVLVVTFLILLAIRGAVPVKPEEKSGT